MKKKILLVISLAAILCLLSGCAMMTMSRIEQMFRDNNSAAVSGDTVTISRSDYDKLMQFSELADLMDPNS